MGVPEAWRLRSRVLKACWSLCEEKKLRRTQPHGDHGRFWMVFEDREHEKSQVMEI